MLLTFLHKKHPNLEVTSCFLSCFWPALPNTPFWWAWCIQDL